MNVVVVLSSVCWHLLHEVVHTPWSMNVTWDMFKCFQRSDLAWLTCFNLYMNYLTWQGNAKSVEVLHVMSLQLSDASQWQCSCRPGRLWTDDRGFFRQLWMWGSTKRFLVLQTHWLFGSLQCLGTLFECVGCNHTHCNCWQINLHAMHALSSCANS